MAKERSWYNGYSWPQRAKMGRIASHAHDAGTFTPPPICALCKLHGIIRGKESPHLMFHLEDYSRPFDAVVICVECHMRLHSRFHAPNRWRQHCLAIREAPAQAWPSVMSYFAMSRRERNDIDEVTIDPLPERWWERLSYDPALKVPIEPGVSIVLTYGAANTLDSLIVTVLRDKSLAEEPKVLPTHAEVVEQLRFL